MRNETWKRLTKASRETWLRRLFRIGVLLKGLDGLLETISGALFLFISRAALNRLVFHLTQPELLEDPDDLIANALRHAFSHLSAGGKLFGSIYLLVHGSIKIFLVVSLLREKLWSFPTAIAVLIACVAYQFYRLSTQFSWTLLFLTLLDILIILVIRHEYHHIKHQKRQLR